MLRRRFLKLSAMTGAATLFPWRSAYAAFAQTIALKKFIQPLRGLGPGGIPVATPVQPGPYPRIDYYEIALRDFYDQLHRPAAHQTLWIRQCGSGLGVPASSGGVIVANRDRPVRDQIHQSLACDAHSARRHVDSRR